MLRYTLQLFGITVFALTLIWFAGPGEAQQNPTQAEPVIWADTVHINLNEANQATETPKPSGDSFLRSIKALNQAMFSRDTPRPPAFPAMFQGFWFSQTFERGAADVSDELVNPVENVGTLFRPFDELLVGFA